MNIPFLVFSRRLFLVGSVFVVSFVSFGLSAADAGHDVNKYKIALLGDELGGGRSADGILSPVEYDHIDNVLREISISEEPAQLCVADPQILGCLQEVLSDSLASGIHELVTIMLKGEPVNVVHSLDDAENLRSEAQPKMIEGVRVANSDFPENLDVFMLPFALGQFEKLSTGELNLLKKDLNDYADGRLRACKHNGEGVYSFCDNGFRAYFSKIGAVEGGNLAILIEAFGDKRSKGKQHTTINTSKQRQKKLKNNRQSS
jgi:hypothetical protein